MLKYRFVPIKEYETPDKKITINTAIYDDENKLLGIYSHNIYPEDTSLTFNNEPYIDRLYKYKNETSKENTGAITDQLFVKIFEDGKLEQLDTIPKLNTFTKKKGDEDDDGNKRAGGRKIKKSKKKRTKNRKSRKTRKP